MESTTNIVLSDSVTPCSLLAPSTSEDHHSNRDLIPFTYTQESLLLRRNHLIEAIKSLIDSLILDIDAANCWTPELEKDWFGMLMMIFCILKKILFSYLLDVF